MHRIKEIAQIIKKAGGRAFYVGGYVRDFVMKRPWNDADIVVFGMELDEIAKICHSRGLNVTLANQNRYPVLMATGEDEGRDVQIEITMPRHGEDSNASVPDATATMRQDAMRRDFTINAMYMDVLTEEIHDPTGGREDIERGVLHYVSPHFVEDPQRVLRAAAAISMYDLRPSTSLIRHCQAIEDCASSIPEEVAGKNLAKLTSGLAVMRAIAFLTQVGYLSCYPEIDVCENYNQKTSYHNEDLLHHLCMVAQECVDRNLGMDFVLAGLYHDVGKLTTQTIDESGQAHYVGHEDASEKYARYRFLKMGLGTELTNRVCEFIKYHMRFTMKPSQVSPRFVRKLNASLQHITFEELVDFVGCDRAGREPRQDNETAERALELLRNLKEDKPFECYVRGQDLIDLGMEQGPGIGAVLSRAKEAQINGVFTDRDGGIAWLHQQVTLDSPRIRVYLDVREADIKELGVDSATTTQIKQQIRERVLKASAAIWNELSASYKT